MLPPNDELEAAAVRVPESARQLTGFDDQGHVYGWSSGEPIDRSGVRPIFSFENRVKGIAVPGLGIVPRDQYEAPGFDAEAAAKAKWGDQYALRLKVKAEKGFS